MATTKQAAVPMIPEPNHVDVQGVGHIRPGEKDEFGRTPTLDFQVTPPDQKRAQVPPADLDSLAAPTDPEGYSDGGSAVPMSAAQQLAQDLETKRKLLQLANKEKEAFQLRCALLESRLDQQKVHGTCINSAELYLKLIIIIA